MGERITVQKGIDLTREFSKRQNKRRKRTHANAFDTNMQIRRSLEGICGHCSNLKVETTHYQGKNFVHLRCSAGKSPYTLYVETPFGQEAECSDYDDKKI